MRCYGAFEVKKGVGALHEEPVPPEELADAVRAPHGRVYTFASKPADPYANLAPTWRPRPPGSPPGPRRGRRPGAAGLAHSVGAPRVLPQTLVEWGWPEYALPTYIESHVHPSRLEDGQMPLISTFRRPVQTPSGSTRSPTPNPLWIHPGDAARVGVDTGDLVRVETDLGHFVVKARVTEGIRPGVVACSHHMGRWRPATEQGQLQAMAVVDLDHHGSQWGLKRRRGVKPFL